jgi:hypothetical protein
MPNYRARLDHIEAVLSPRDADAWFPVWIDEGTTLEESATRYALNHGLAVASVLERGIFVRWLKPSESAEGDDANGWRPPCPETA